MKKLSRPKVFGINPSSVDAFLLLILAFILMIIGFSHWSIGDEMAPVDGGKGSVFSLAANVASIFLRPIFGDKSISVFFFILTFITVRLAIKYYKKRHLD